MLKPDETFRYQFSKSIILFVLLIFSGPQLTKAQYFGRNKPSYRSFNYHVTRTPHFDIYNYLHNDSFLTRYASLAETWYKMHQQVFRDTFKTPNPVLLYSNHPDFQQTTAISGLIGVGTGGVTEALRNRIVLPVMYSDALSNHVLGHEMVHAFQYHMLIHGDSTSLNSIRNLPLWMVEGMAEYLSIGSVDGLTAMWMRDAILNDDFPSLDDMTKNPGKYFPYRYGEAFWAFVSKMYGDRMIVPLFLQTAKFGYDAAIDSLLGFNSETFSNMWAGSTKEYYSRFLTDSVDQLTGKHIVSKENAGEINIGPSLSPDGKYLAFLSEKDVFTLDMYLADAKTGKIIKRMGTRAQSNKIDDYNYLESSGTWSPDSKQFAFVVVGKGKNQLLVMDVDNVHKSHIYEIPGVNAFANPAWSPDGENILVSGLVEGQSDLYLFNLKTKKVKRLTDDYYANLQPQWSSDGRYIVFSTDKGSFNPTKTGAPEGYSIAILDTKTGKEQLLPVFPRASNLNPLFSSDNRSVYFLSNSDGFRNLYRYSLDSMRVYRLTNYMTGISGITEIAPAVTIARDNDQLVYTYYLNNGYTLYEANGKDFKEEEVDPLDINFDAAILPPYKHIQPGFVDKNIESNRVYRELSDSAIKRLPYKPKFQLTYIGNSGVGVSTSRYGTGMAGSVEMLFSDIVGNNQLYAGVSLNGEIYDFGGQVSYINQKNRLNWGGSVSHIPYRFGSYSIKKDTLQLGDSLTPVDNLMLDIIRMFQDQVSVFGYYPISQTQRIEVGGALSWYYYRIDRYNNYYLGYYNLGVTRERNLPAPDGFNLQQLNAAYVTDNSYFGMTSPLRGSRSRFEVEKYFGSVGMYTALADFRKYMFVKPVSLAVRLYHYGRYGKDSENNIMSPLYIGYPWLIRGFGSLTSNVYQNSYIRGNSTYNSLYGSKIAVANFEVRLPFTGPEQLALIKSKLFLTQLALFTDAGVAWTDYTHPVFKLKSSNQSERPLLLSTGVSLRVNLFGALILEPYYAIPLQGNGLKDASFGLNFTPGW